MKAGRDRAHTMEVTVEGRLWSWSWDSGRGGMLGHNDKGRQVQVRVEVEGLDGDKILSSYMELVSYLSLVCSDRAQRTLHLGTSRGVVREKNQQAWGTTTCKTSSCLPSS